MTRRAILVLILAIVASASAYAFLAARTEPIAEDLVGVPSDARDPFPLVAFRSSAMRAAFAAPSQDVIVATIISLDDELVTRAIVHGVAGDEFVLAAPRAGEYARTLLSASAQGRVAFVTQFSQAADSATSLAPPSRTLLIEGNVPAIDADAPISASSPASPSATARDASAWAWRVTELAFEGGACCPITPLDLALSPDGAAHILVWKNGGLVLETARDGAWSARIVYEGLTFGSLDVAADGEPVVCYGRDGSLLAWRGAGDEVVMMTGAAADVYDCAIREEADGRAWAIAARLPIVGRSCIVNDVCTASADSGKLIVLTRDERDGSWLAKATKLPYVGTPFLSSSGEYRFVHARNGSSSAIYEVVARDLVNVRDSGGDVDDSYLPRANVSPPLVIEILTDDRVILRRVTRLA